MKTYAEGSVVWDFWYMIFTKESGNPQTVPSPVKVAQSFFGLTIKDRVYINRFSKNVFSNVIVTSFE